MLLPNPTVLATPVIAPDLVVRFEQRRGQMFALLDAALRGGIPSVDELDALRTAFHLVAGTAGLFGQVELGRIAADLDDRLADATPGDAMVLLREGRERLGRIVPERR